MSKLMNLLLVNYMEKIFLRQVLGQFLWSSVTEAAARKPFHLTSFIFQREIWSLRERKTGKH